MRLVVCDGPQSLHTHVGDDELTLLCEGAVRAETPESSARLQAGELTVIPKNTEHRLVADARALVLLMARVAG
jgi:quercetin dioxygenase-like cupin family protein